MFASAGRLEPESELERVGGVKSPLVEFILEEACVSGGEPARPPPLLTLLALLLAMDFSVPTLALERRRRSFRKAGAMAAHNSGPKAALSGSAHALGPGGKEGESISTQAGRFRQHA